MIKGKAVINFSKRFSKLSEEAKDEIKLPQSKEKLLQEQIMQQEEERAESLKKQYQDFLNPQTKDLEEDEEALLNSYNLFCKINEISSEYGKVRLRSTELVSSICKKSEYTQGQSFAVLRIWFLNTVKDCEYLPQLIQAENGNFYLDFISRELWTPDSLEKELLQYLEESPSDSSLDLQ